MFSATAFVIRDARVDDVPELVRLGWATRRTGRPARSSSARSTASSPPPSPSTRTAPSSADMTAAPRLLAHMRARAAGIQAYKRTPSVADRFREQMRRRIAVGA